MTTSFKTNADYMRAKAVRIQRVIGDCVALELDKDGYRGNCPWCGCFLTLKVKPDRQLYKCIRCQVGGDIFAFVMSIRGGINFWEAVEYLVKQYAPKEEEAAGV